MVRTAGYVDAFSTYWMELAVACRYLREESCSG